MRVPTLALVSALFVTLALAGNPVDAAGRARAALNKNKYGGRNGRVEQSQKKGKKTHGGASKGVSKDERIVWFKPDAEVFEAAAKDKNPIVLFFPEADLDLMDAGEQLYGEKIHKVSDDSALFVLVEYNSDRTPSFNDGSKVPTSKLLSPNLSRDYDVRKHPTYIVCDWFGNEYKRYTKTPSEKALLKTIGGIKNDMEALDKKLEKTLEDARKALKDKDLPKFFKAAQKNFKTGTVGLKSAEETIRLYRKQLDEGREKMNKVLDDRPEDGEDQLKDLSKAYRDTELETEIKDAIDILKG
jgi:hypothetical protein